MFTAGLAFYKLIKQWYFAEQGHLIQELNRLTTEVRFRSDENDKLREDLRELRKTIQSLRKEVRTLRKELANG